MIAAPISLTWVMHHAPGGIPACAAVVRVLDVTGTRAFSGEVSGASSFAESTMMSVDFQNRKNADTKTKIPISPKRSSAVVRYLERQITRNYPVFPFKIPVGATAGNKTNRAHCAFAHETPNAPPLLVLNLNGSFELARLQGNMLNKYPRTSQFM